MAVRTVRLSPEAYERLCAARNHPGESFSDIILRARWPDRTITGALLLAHLRQREPALTLAEADELEAELAAQRATLPVDKWTTR